MFRVSGLLLLALLLPTPSFGDNVTFLRIDSSVLQQRLQAAPGSAEARVAMLRHLFVEAGCAREEMQQQAVPNQAEPNLICILPGSELGTIVIGAPLDYDARGDEGSVGWATLSMLPLLVESLQSAPHRHTYVFVAFAGGDSLSGSSFFLKQLSDVQRRDIRGVVALDHIGRTSAQYATEGREGPMASLLPASAKALRLPHAPGEVSGISASDAQTFERTHIPAITIYSPPIEVATPDASHAGANDIAPDLRRAGLHDSPQGAAFKLKTGVDLNAYNETYNLLCVYLLFLDRGLGATKRTATEVASAAPGTPPLMAPAPQTPAMPTTPTAALAAEAIVQSTASAAPAQASAVAQNVPKVQGPTFRASARLVQVDVVVTDKQGRPVHDLKQADFTVLEDGTAQSIRAFEVRQSAAKVNPATQTSTRTTKPVSQTNAPSYSNFPKVDGAAAWTIVLFDVLNTAPADQSFARKQLLDLVKSIPAGQPTAVYVLTQHLEMAQNFTQDPAQLLGIVQQLTPTKSQILTTQVERERTLNDVQAAARQAQPSAVAQGTNLGTDGMAFNMASRIEQGYKDHEAFRLGDRVVFTLDAMKGLARAVSGYPGRKNLLWLSGSFPVQINADPFSQDEFRNMRGFEKDIGAASALLATSRVAVYPIDVRGLQSRGVDITIATAENTTMADPLPAGSVTGLAAPSASTLGSSLSQQAVNAADERTTMKRIAEQTGGEAFINTNDLRRVMERSLEDGASYYTLAYVPPKDDAVGGYHRIDVKLDKPGTRLSYRRGYYLVPVNASSGRGVGALRSALQPGMPPATMLLVSVSVDAPDGARKEARIRFLISADGVTFSDVPGDKKHAEIDCMAVAFDKEGREVAHASDTLDATFPASAYEQIMLHGLPAQQEIALPAGSYNLKIGVMDRATQRIGTVEVPVSVPGVSVAQR